MFSAILYVVCSSSHSFDTGVFCVSRHEIMESWKGTGVIKKDSRINAVIVDRHTEKR